MKGFRDSLGRVMRLAVALAVVVFSGAASAEWLWWTTDFVNDWGTGEPKPNPAGEGATGYDIYLIVKSAETGDWVSTVRGGAIVDDQLLTDEGDILVQMDVTDFASDEYVFFVEMVKSTETVYDTRYLSDDYSYSSLVAAGHVAEEMEAFSMPWNPAVDGLHVPEPTGGLLGLLGLGLLMLRRRRC